MKKLLLGALLFMQFNTSAQTTIYEDDFETTGTFIMSSTSTNQWVINNVYSGAILPTVPAQPASFTSPNGNYLHPISNAFAGLVDQANYQLPGSEQMMAVMTSTMNLSNYQNTEISFWRTGGSGGLTVMYSINNGPWQLAYTVTGNPTTWQQETFTLNAVDGQINVRIGFEFDESSALDPAPNHYHSIDELLITATSTSTVDEITADVSDLTYCGDDQIQVFYSVVSGTINAGNVFTLELSDATGSFATATTIGTLASTNTAGSITGTIPNGLSGNGFRVRVNSDDDPITGSPNGADITINTLPVVDAGNNQAICEGDQVTLTATNPDGATITWDNGVTDNTPFTPTMTQTYTVTADLNGCTSTDNLEVTVNPLPAIDAGTDLEICEGDEITLTAGNPDGATISWDNGVTDNTPFVPTMTQTYTVTAVLNGCTATDQMTVFYNSTPTAPTISLNANNDLEVALGTGQTVEWYLDGVLISGQTGATLTPTTNGDYTAIIVDGICSSEESATFVVDFVNLSSFDVSSVLIYPNPANDVLHISSPQKERNTIAVTDLNGRIVYENNFEKSLTINVSAFDAGVYFVRLNNTAQLKKLIVK